MNRCGAERDRGRRGGATDWQCAARRTKASRRMRAAVLEGAARTRHYMPRTSLPAVQQRERNTHTHTHTIPGVLNPWTDGILCTHIQSPSPNKRVHTITALGGWCRPKSASLPHIRNCPFSLSLSLSLAVLLFILYLAGNSSAVQGRDVVSMNSIGQCVWKTKRAL